MTGPHTLRLLDHNLKVHRPVDAVIDGVQQAIEDHRQPHLLTFHEAVEYAHEIRDALDDYRVYFETGWEKAADNLIAVRRDLKSEQCMPIRMRERWTGPKSPTPRNQPGRTWPVVNIEDHWRSTSIHRCTGHVTGPNTAAGAEEFGNLVRFVERRGSDGRALLAPGDWNGWPSQTGPRSLGRFVDTVGGKVIVPGPGVDHLWVRGADAEGRVGKAYGSDHKARGYTVTLGKRYR